MRNKKTGYYLKLHFGKNGSPYFSIRKTDHSIFCRSPKFFRRIAVAAAHKNSFAIIPSLGGRYEINKYGTTVRNVKTKAVLKPRRSGKAYCFQIGRGKFFSRATADLLWEAHGIIIPRRFRPQPVIIESVHGKFFFANCRACARWLAPKVFLAVGSICNTYFSKRRTQLGDWKISYPSRDLSGDIDWNSRGLSDIAKRQAKLERK